MVRNNSENKSEIIPYVSFVIGGRNDNYGGNFLYRMQNFIDNLMGLCKKYFLKAEIVIVEWNPPLDKKRLWEELNFSSKKASNIEIRFIEVPEEIHNQFPNADKMPIFEYIAKNVGIKRAKGEYILATNPDIIFSEEIIKFLSEKKLSPKYFYRADRYDVKKIIPPGLSIEEKIIFCKRNWFRANTFYKKKYKVVNFLKISELLKVCQYVISRLKSYFKNIFVKKVGKVGSGDKKPEIPALFTDASGDFFLMAKEVWHKIRGYPEIPFHSHIDSLICYIAAINGISQFYLQDGIIYHQEHNRTESKKRPLTDYQKYIEEIFKDKRFKFLNSENWGLDNLKLKELRF